MPVKIPVIQYYKCPLPDKMGAGECIIDIFVCMCVCVCVCVCVCDYVCINV